MLDLIYSQICLVFSHYYVTTVLILVLLYLIGTYNNDYFEKQGVPFIRPLPLFGSNLPMLLGTKNMAYVLEDMCKSFPDAKFFGIYDFIKPLYIVKDPDIIKQVCIKEFDHFVDHRSDFDEELNPLFARNLFGMKGERWRTMRAILSPAFTGSKMRLMFELITNYCEDATKTVLNMVNEEHGIKEFNLTDLFTRFGTDIIASCAFGYEINSIRDPENDFFINGKILTRLDGLPGLKLVAYGSIPKVMKFFKISMFDKKIEDFFRHIITDTIAYREKNNFVRNDMVNLLMQARKNELKSDKVDKKYDSIGFSTVDDYELEKSDKVKFTWTDDDITAQCLVFFFAGFETASRFTCFVAHELAVNPDVQEKLRAEILEMKNKLKGEKLTYEDIQQMKYLDMVISETQRLRPQVHFLDRKCNKATTFIDDKGNEVNIRVGDEIFIPVLEIHKDPRYFPDPEKFIPERFSIENKVNIDPATYLNFGLGPRNCIGSRFALMQAKAIIFHLLSNFSLEMSSKTQHPFKLPNRGLLLVPSKGFWLNFRTLK